MKSEAVLESNKITQNSACNSFKMEYSKNVRITENVR